MKSIRTLALVATMPLWLACQRAPNLDLISSATATKAQGQAGIWVQKTILEQARTPEGVTRCGELPRFVPYSFAVSKEGQITMSHGAVSNPVVLGRIDSFHNVHAADPRNPKLFEHIEIQGDVMTATYHIEKTPKTLVYWRSNRAEAEKAFAQHGACFQQIDLKSTSDSPIALENRATLAKNKLSIALDQANREFVRHRLDRYGYYEVMFLASAGYLTYYVTQVWMPERERIRKAMQIFSKDDPAYSGAPRANNRKLGKRIALVIGAVALGYTLRQLWQKPLPEEQVADAIHANDLLTRLLDLDDADFRAHIREFPADAETVISVLTKLAQ